MAVTPPPVEGQGNSGGFALRLQDRGGLGRDALLAARDTLLAQTSSGISTGEAMAELERIASELPAGIGYEWTGLSYQEKVASGQAAQLFALAILVVFLLLVALYESWAIPLTVMLIVPVGALGAVLAVTAVGMPNDVYFKVGLITIIGLSAKNAILIVEFAKDLHAQGRSLRDAAIEAARLRFRPIIMTSMAFILGVVPLTLATGAGCHWRHVERDTAGRGVRSDLLRLGAHAVAPQNRGRCRPASRGRPSGVSRVGVKRGEEAGDCSPRPQ